MIQVTLPFRCQDALNSSRALTKVELPVGPWESIVHGLRNQQPQASSRFLTDSGTIASGFALVHNDEVVHRTAMPPTLRTGDELYVIATFAGG